VQYVDFAFRWMNCLLMRELPLLCTIRLVHPMRQRLNYGSKQDGGAGDETPPPDDDMMTAMMIMLILLFAVGHVSCGDCWVCELSHIRLRSVPKELFGTTARVSRLCGEGFENV
jgi:hypothetical protein